MSIGTCVGIIIGSVIISCGISEFGKIGRPRNEYDDYIQAMTDIQKLRNWNGEITKFFDSPSKINNFVDELQKDLRERFVNADKNKI